MKEALHALNRLVADGIIENYAIGGAIGAAFYIKATQTEDIDAFVFLPVSPSGLIVITPIYDALIALGGVSEREHVRFGSWPLQILPDADALISEAIHSAVPVSYDGTPTRIFRPDFLCAIALQTGRNKDKLRVRMFLEQDAVDRNHLTALLERFKLSDRLNALISGDHQD